MDTLILGVESSCDDTSAAILNNRKILANVTANQEVHKNYGGVVPELASRAHQQNIIPVVDQAFHTAKVQKKDINAIAVTFGPGLLGSLLVGASFSKTLAMALQIPLLEVNHMHAHILVHFIEEKGKVKFPGFPFLCLTVSGGHTQIVLVKSHYDFEIIGQTIDDAAGEAFDKAAKIMGLPYPGGPLIDKYAQKGNPEKFPFPHPKIPDLDYSFSGLKTSILYFIRDELKKDKNFIKNNKYDLCASIQYTIVEILMNKLKKASLQTGIKQIAIAGGVSANSSLRKALNEEEKKLGWQIFIPPFEYCTDNAAMIAIAGYYKYIGKDFASQDATPFTRYR